MSDEDRDQRLIEALREADSQVSFSARAGEMRQALAAEASPKRSARRRLLVRILPVPVTALLIVIGALASQEARPGSSFYGIKRVSEAVWLRASISDEVLAVRHIDLAQNRTDEAELADRSLRAELVDRSEQELSLAEEIVPRLGADRRGELENRISRIRARNASLLESDGSSASRSGSGSGESHEEDKIEPSPSESPSNHDGERDPEPSDSGSSKPPSPSPTEHDDHGSGGDGGGSSGSGEASPSPTAHD